MLGRLGRLGRAWEALAGVSWRSLDLSWGSLGTSWEFLGVLGKSWRAWGSLGEVLEKLVLMSLKIMVSGSVLILYSRV